MSESSSWMFCVPQGIKEFDEYIKNHVKCIQAIFNKQIFLRFVMEPKSDAIPSFEICSLLGS